MYVYKIITSIEIAQKFGKKKTDYTKRKCLELFFIHSNNHVFNDKTNCFYPTAYHNLKILK